MSDQKRRITKSEKITELQSKLKLLTEENKRLKEKKIEEGKKFYETGFRGFYFHQ